MILTPPGLPNPSLAIAASRAGGLGVLDLEYTHNKQTTRESIKELAKYTRNDFGIKLNADAIEFLAEITSDLPEHLRVVILTYADPQRLEQQVQTLRGRGLTVILESTCLEQARVGEQIGVDGIIAKGHEAGGRVGNETTFILLQRLLKCLSLPVWAQGGIGLHTAAACYAAGAAGVILDVQLALTRESSLPEGIKTKISSMDGTQTTCLGNEIGECYRVCSRLGIHAIEELQRKEKTLIKDASSQSENAAIWREAVSQSVGWDSLERHLFFLGQDVAFAAPLARQFLTVGGVLEAIYQTIDSHCQAAWSLRPLGEGSPLAQSHGTRYPIVQGPMARVSDTPDFADQVVQKGALPFLALSQMGAQQVDRLLRETRTLLKEKVWGVGLLGFLPPDLYKEQVKVVIDHHPRFALIAGGRPNQVSELEQKGISTYLHVPSPGLLRMFLNDGVGRFVFEGREAGGHVGPLCGFVLWEAMINVLLEHIVSSSQSKEFHVLFAGGIHDSLSASMVTIMAAPLAERGVKVGVQLGSAYLFTEEAVSSGAIVKGYRQEVIKCDQTCLLESGPGHAIRCVDTPYVRNFHQEKRRLAKQGKSAGEIRHTMESMNLGRLRIASKGTARNPNHGKEAKASNFVHLNEEEQRTQGVYMIGQVAALRDKSFSISELHHDISVNGSTRIEQLYEKRQEPARDEKDVQPSDIAIIGMACVFPKASNLQKYWENILNKVDAIREVPKDRWNWNLYYDTDPKARDKSYSKWGAFLDDVPFDPVRYGMPPNSLRSIEPLHLLTLEVANWALDDAGYSKRPFPRECTSVILGVSGAGELNQAYSFRSALPAFFGNSSQDILSRFDEILPEWTEDSQPGILGNVAAGRVANRFDLGGTNYTVDAACGSSLAAVYLGVKELESQSSDMVIVGAADCLQNPFTYLAFSKTRALSPRGRCRTFDESADGIILGEGIAVVILKRLADAERDGDRVYAVIKGVGASSDGRDKSLTAPRREGQVRAFQRAYAKAGFSPDTVGLIEAHGTGTVVGDRVEIEALSQVFKDAQSNSQGCAIGSVKSMIGHTKSTAGLAGLIKVALALHHKVLPPTLGVETPNQALRLPDSPFHANTETRPWIHRTPEHPRRAGVSALGFGGTNFHVVMEEYTGDFLSHLDKASFQEWPSELIVWKANSRQALLEAIGPLEKVLSQGAKPALGDLAFTLSKIDEQTKSPKNVSLLRLALVATSLEDLRQKLGWTREVLSNSNPVVHDPRGIYFSEQPLGLQGKVAFLFPGQGSQYLNMLWDLTIQFHEVRALFERSNRILKDRLPKALSTFIFPPPTFSEDEKNSTERALAQAHIAQPAMGTADLAMFHLLKSLGIKPDMVAGHSYGEYVALCAAGVLSEDDLIALSEARGRFIVEAAGAEPGTMAAVNAGIETVSEALRGIEGVWIANLNAPEQTIISGTQSAVEETVKRFKSSGIRARLIPVACAFHSPIVSRARERFREFLSGIEFTIPNSEVYSNTTARPYPKEPEAIAQQLVQHLVSRVEFIREIEAMYEDGARIFVEVGPGRVLSGLVDQIIGDWPHLTVTSNQSGRSGLVQLHHCLGQLAVHGVPIKMDRLYQGRSLGQIDLKALEKGIHQANLSPTTWLVNGARAKPMKEVSASDSAQTTRPIQLTIAKEQAVAASAEPQKEQAPTSPHPVSQTDVQPTSSISRSGGPIKKSFDSPSPSGDGATQVMLQYQQLMNRFVDTQKNVMMTYLQNTRGDVNLHDEALQNTVQGESVLPTSSQQDFHTPLTHDQPDVPSHEASPEQTPATPSTLPETPAGASDFPSAEEDIFADPQVLTSRLLQIVSERTGYPEEILDMDLDLEADLGIDSIKRVEIVGNFMQLVFPPDKGGLPGEREDLSGMKTLRGIIDSIERHRGSIGKSGGSEEVTPLRVEPTPDPPPESTKEEILPRFTLTALRTPLATRAAGLSSDRVLMVTDDERGVAQALTEKLKNRGYKVVLVRCNATIEETEEHCYGLKTCSAEAITGLVETIRQRQGSFGGLIHLLPLKEWIPYKKIDMTGWKERLRLEVRTLFHLLKLLQVDLEQAAKEGGACVVSATGMGGSFVTNTGGNEREFFPGQGAIPGLLKTVGAEWPEVRIKAVDLNLEEPASDLADHLLSEIETDDRLVEVGYDGSGRVGLHLIETPLVGRTETVLKIDSSWTILLTGGARGITAKVARELARQYQPTLILAGRSPLPPEEESEETSRLTSAQELKTALIARMQHQGKHFTLADVEATYRQLCNEREIRSNLAAMQKAGAKVEYFQVDVRDEHGFGSLIDNIYRTHHRIDGVIHGAGIIEDKLLKDKTWESFDRVFGTKVESIFTLSRKLRPEALKLLVLFSSIAGRFGNRGQCDYTAANEVLNKLAVYLDKRWPGRVVSVNWGPWDKSGMVSAELKRDFARRGVRLIPPVAGSRMLNIEILKGRKGEAQVVIGDGPWGAIEDVASDEAYRQSA